MTLLLMLWALSHGSGIMETSEVIIAGLITPIYPLLFWMIYRMGRIEQKAGIGE